MAKAKEFFTLLKNQGKINEPEFDELIEKVPDFEIPEKAHKAFENSFYTLDRASTNTMIKNKIRADALDPVDRDIEKIINAIASVDKDSAGRLKSLLRDGDERKPDTYKRTEFLANQLSDIFGKVKGAPNGDEELKKEIEKYKHSLQESLEKFSTLESDYKKQLSSKDKEYEEKLHDYQLDNELEKLAGSFTLAEAYEQNRSSINKVILSELKNSNKLKLGVKDGQKIINVFDDKGEPKYNGNSPILINQLVEEKFKPFLKQSNGPPPQKASHTTVTVPNQQNPSVRRGVPTAVTKRN